MISDRRMQWRYGNVENADMKRKDAVNPGNALSAVRRGLLPRRKNQMQLVAVAVVPVNKGEREYDHGGMQ